MPSTILKVSCKTIAAISLVVTLGMILISPHIVIADQTKPPVITLDCGPRANSDLSITVMVRGFKPNEFVLYRIMRSDNRVIEGGFSSSHSGENNATINIGPHDDKVLLNFYRDFNSNNSAESNELLRSSSIHVPCQNKHFGVDYYRTHPGVIGDLFGIRSLRNEIKLGNHVVDTSQNAIKILGHPAYDNSQAHFAAELLAATINILRGGSDDCVQRTISRANTFLEDQNYVGGGQEKIPVKPSNGLETDMLSMTTLLKEYNQNGCL
jgi:hypothetical protein